MHHESRIFQRKGNMVDLILIRIAEIYVPTQRPDTNCAILINAVSLCKLQSEPDLVEYRVSTRVRVCSTGHQFE
jgi:hypothetical protein